MQWYGRTGILCVMTLGYCGVYGNTGVIVGCSVVLKVVESQSPRVVLECSPGLDTLLSHC